MQNSQKQRVSWKVDRALSVAIAQEDFPAQYLPAVEKALAIWAQDLGAQSFQFYGPLPASQIGDMDIKIYWSTDWDDENRREQARTLIKWRGSSIYSASIYINDRHHNFFLDSPQFGRVDLVALMVHELGHAFGLAHIEEDSVMLPELASNFAGRRKPTDTDLVNLSCEYNLVTENL